MTTVFGSAIALQTRREVRRLANDAALLRLARSNQGEPFTADLSAPCFGEHPVAEPRRQKKLTSPLLR